MRFAKRKAVLFAAASGALIQSAFSANQTWNSLTANPSWSIAANWSSGPLAGRDLLFFDSAVTTSLNNDLSGQTFNGITFNAAAPSYSLAGNGIQLGVQATGTGITNASDIVNASAADQTIALALTLNPGKHNISTLTNALNLNGVITQNKGAVAVFSTTGGIINLAGSGLTNDGSNAGGILGGWATIGSQYATLDASNHVVPYTGYTDLNAGTYIVSNPTSNVRIPASGAAINPVVATTPTTYSINSLMFGNGSVAVAAAQTVNVGLGNTLKLGQNGGIFITTGAVGTLRALNIDTSVVNGGNITAGDGIHAANITISSNPIFPASTTISTIDSSIKDNGSAPVSVTLNGGYIGLNNNNSYTGGTYVIQGRVSQPTRLTFGTGPVYIFPGGEINPGGSFVVTVPNDFFISGNGTGENNGLGALRMFQNTNGDNTLLTGTITLMDTASVCSNNNSASNSSVGLTGKITGPGGLQLGSPVTNNANGLGTVTIGALAGSGFQNDYAGDTTINGGTNGATAGSGLRIGNPTANNIMPHGLTGSFAGGPTGNVILNAGAGAANFDLNGSTQTINGLTNTAANPGNNNVVSALAGGLLIVGDSNATATYAGNINDGNGRLGITKIGNGIQTLSGNLNYTGNTTVTSGTLLLSGSANINNSKLVDVQSGGNLDVTANGLSISGGQVFGGSGNVFGAVSMNDSNASLVPGQARSAGTLTINGDLSLGSGLLRMDMANAAIVGGGVNDLLKVNGNLNLNGGTTLQIDRPLSGLANGTYTLIKYTLALANNGGFNLPANTRPTLNISTSTAGEVDLIVGGSASMNLTFSGNASNNAWDLVGPSNFNSGAQQFFNWDSVTFDNSGINSSDVTINSSLEPTTVTLANTTTHPYTFSGGGQFTNVTNLNKTGNGIATFNVSGANKFENFMVNAGTFILQSSNNTVLAGTVGNNANLTVLGQGTFSNFTVAAGGRLDSGDGVTGGTGDLRGTITDNGTVDFNRPDNGGPDSNASFSGTGTIRKQGTGQLNIDVSSPNFTGTFEIAAGSVRMNANSWNLLGSTSAGTVVISSGAQLSVGGISTANLGGISEGQGGGFGARTILIAGAGPDSNGAIVNDGGVSQATAFQRVTLTGNATIGASSRLDIRGGFGNLMGSLDLAGNTLTKGGGNILGLANVNVTDGNISVASGTLQLEGQTNVASLSSSTSITVASGLGINFVGENGTVTRPIVFTGDGNLSSINSAASLTTSTIGSNITLGGNLTLNATSATANASALVLNGNISETAANPGRSLTKANVGTAFVTLAGINSYTGGTTVQGGTLTTNSNFSNGTLNVSGGTARVAQHPTNGDPAGVTVIPSLSISPGSVLDLANNGLVVDYALGNSQLVTIQGYVKAGYANGALTGTGGINSSTAATNNLASANKRAIGYAEASALGIVGTGNFLGKTVDDSSILVRYTLSGDANLDGKVNAVDFNAVASNFGASGTGIWTSGDFNNDANVDTGDFTLLAQNFNQSLPAAPPAPALGALVPEPGTVSLMVIGACALVGRRRRR